MTHEIYGILASAIGIVAYLIYIFGMFKKNEKPHIFTWIIWGAMTMILWYVQLVEKAGAGAWVTFIGFIFCFIIAACAWKNGEKNITRTDWGFFIVGMLSIPLWYFTHDPLAAVILLTVIDFVAIYPTLRKSLTNPWQENLLFYFITTIKYALGICAIENMVIANWLYPASMVFECAVMTVLLWVGRKYVTKTN